MENKMGIFLGVDTSNYTTSLSLSENGRIVKNLRRILDVEAGKRGLRQSDAVFLHTVNLPLMFEEIGRNSISAVGVSVRPRDAEGSYMPCFLAGISAAKAVSSVCGVPVYEFSHQAGHIAAALYSCNSEYMHGKRFLAFHVSGGTTEIVLCDNNKITLLGGTKDISAGMAIDRIGVLLGLRFPCGKELEELSHDAGQVKIGRISVNGTTCNLSGLENTAMKLMKDGADRSYIAMYTLSFIAETLSKMTENAISEYGNVPVLYAGGVMSNKYIRNVLTSRFGGIFAEPEFSCDNAAGIARLAEMKYFGD